MIRSIFLLAAALPPLVLPAGAHAHQAGGACIVREQAEQLVTTLKQRNEQLRDLSQRLQQMEAKVAAAEATLTQVENSRKAIAIATTKNRELTEIGEAIVADYEHRKLGSRIASGEPLTQLYRVKLENKMQEYRDQIAAQGFYAEREMETMQAAPAATPASAPAAEPAPAETGS